MDAIDGDVGVYVVGVGMDRDYVLVIGEVDSGKGVSGGAEDGVFVGALVFGPGEDDVEDGIFAAGILGGYGVHFCDGSGEGGDALGCDGNAFFAGFGGQGVVGEVGDVVDGFGEGGGGDGWVVGEFGEDVVDGCVE